MPDRKVFTDSVTPLPDHPGAAPHGLLVNLAAPAAEPAEPMTILFSLDLPGDLKAELEAKVAAGEVVPRDQLAARFSPDKAKLDKLVDWLKAQGYEITEVAADNSGVYARADIATIENSLQVKMVPVLKDGITYTAAQNAPSLPTDIGDPVHAIVGLQPFRRAHRNFRRRFVTAANRGGLDASGTPSPNIANAPPYLCAEMLKAYGASALGLTGDKRLSLLPDVAKLFKSVAGGITLYQFDADEKFAFYYAHLDRYAEGLQEGRLVKRGELLGYVGTTGNAPPGAPHLHFTIFRLGPDKRWWKGTAVNPYPFFSEAKR